MKQLLMCRNEVGLHWAGQAKLVWGGAFWWEGPAGLTDGLSGSSPSPLGPHHLGIAHPTPPGCGQNGEGPGLKSSCVIFTLYVLGLAVEPP